MCSWLKSKRQLGQPRQKSPRQGRLFPGLLSDLRTKHMGLMGIMGPMNVAHHPQSRPRLPAQALFDRMPVQIRYKRERGLKARP